MQTNLKWTPMIPARGENSKGWGDAFNRTWTLDADATHLVALRWFVHEPSSLKQRLLPPQGTRVHVQGGTGPFCS